MALLAPVTGWMSERFAAERLCAAGLAVSGSRLRAHEFSLAWSASVEIIVCLGLVGIGMGLFQTPNNNLLMTSVPRHRLGVGSAFLSIVRSLGYSIGAALATTIVGAQLAATGNSSLQSFAKQLGMDGSDIGLTAFMRGFHFACLTAAVFVFSARPSAPCECRERRAKCRTGSQFDARIAERGGSRRNQRKLSQQHEEESRQNEFQQQRESS